MKCAKCAAENRDGRKFCAKCAAPLARSCPQCGASNEPGEDFCGECGAPLGKPSAAKKASNGPILVAETSASENLEGERKTVTILFADIKGSMDLIEDLDPEEARAIVHPALKLMMEAVQHYGGYVAQSTGDGIFALFGAPRADEDHPQRALYAALRMQEELKRYSDRIRAEGCLPIQARVGVNTGEVVVQSIATGEGRSEYVPVGHSTGIAARMQALAPVGSIAATEPIRKLCEGYFVFKSLGPTKVKGVSEPVDVYEVTGPGPLRTHLQRAAARGYTKFVGREREVEVLHQAAEQARAGRGQIVAAMAEPGIGKSRLFFEFKAKHQTGWVVLEAFPVSHGKASAYLPVLDLLHSYFKITSDDDAPTRREKVTGRVLALDRALEDTLPYLFALLGIIESIDSLAQMDANIRKLRTLDAIKRILLRESLNQPLIVMFEDLHWIDEQTQEFLNLFAHSIANAKILLLVNYRPEYSHQWGSRTYYTQLRLDPLRKESADQMLSALLGDAPEMVPLKKLIIEKTEGNPFFMEETYQVLLDEGALMRNGVTRLIKPISELKIPSTVQGILAARIDRLPADAKDLLQTLSVIGRQFPMPLVRTVVAKSDDALERMLNGLQLGEFIYEQPAVGDTEYIFKHARTREVAYNSVLQERRKLMHERIGGALERLYANSLDDHLAELAHHYACANNATNAVRYLTLAGKQALERSAFAEAQAQLQQGLEWIKKLPESPGRDAQELELASALVQVSIFTRGYSAPVTVEIAARASALAQKGGDLAQVVLQKFGAWTGALVGGDYLTAAALADQLLELAQREGSPTSLAFAHDAELQVRLYRGDLAGAEEHFIQISSLFDEPGFAHHTGQFVLAVGLASDLAFSMGRADTARQRLAQTLGFSRNSPNSYDVAFGEFFEAYLCLHLRDAHRAEVALNRTLVLAEEGGFPYLSGLARVLLGWARTQLGDAADGVILIREGLTVLTQVGSRVAMTLVITLLAEAQALAGKIDDALGSIEEALLANPEELLCWPHALTTRGELRLKTGKPDLAEADFRQAIAVAQKTAAKSYELRATTILARLLRDTGRRDEARAMLAAIYNWFTEGFDTADLKDAKALLDELSA